jgi:hypothetical protein
MRFSPFFLEELVLKLRVGGTIREANCLSYHYDQFMDNICVYFLDILTFRFVSNQWNLHGKCMITSNYMFKEEIPCTTLTKTGIVYLSLKY